MSSNRKRDAIVIGAGHNGLVAAAYLARAGLDVVVLEKRHLVGGATVTEELVPGFKFSVFSYVVSLLRPEIIRDLRLPEFGLTMLPLESTVTPLANGDRIYRDGERFRTYREIARHSPRDADAYEEYGHNMYFMAKAVKEILTTVPPDPTSFKPNDIATLLRTGRHFLGLDRQHLMTLSGLMTMSAVDFLEQWFETDPLIATLSASGIIGTFLGPRSPGTAYVLLHHYMGEIDGHYRAWGFARGGTGSVAEALRASAESFGAEVRTSAGVEQVMVKNGRAVGVALESGEELYSDLILSSLDPNWTFLKLVDAKHLPDEVLEASRRYKSRGSSAKVNLALDGLPELACMPGRGRHLAGAISFSPSIDYLERAYDDAKYGRFSRRPYIDVIIPSMIDPDMAPPGKHVMSCFVQYAPYHLAEGNWESEREKLGDAVVETLSERFPGIKEMIIDRQVVTPIDIEESIGLTGGNIFQGDLSLSQLFFMRPFAGHAQYRTPIKGYFQSGSAAHPGGGIAGSPGQLAARIILKELRRR